MQRSVISPTRAQRQAHLRLSFLLPSLALLLSLISEGVTARPQLTSTAHHHHTTTTRRSTSGYGSSTSSISSSGSGSGGHVPFGRYRAQQSFFCSRVFPSIKEFTPPFMQVANMTMSGVAGVPHFPMYVHNDQDIVSHHIKVYGEWEALQVRSTLRLLDDYRIANKLNKADVTFLDIGSNIGVFALSVAMAGYNVIAFEPMQRNEMMLRSSICANDLMDRITYINLGLSTKRMTCRMISAKVNSGNGVALCDDQQPVPAGYEVRTTIQIDSLDALIPPNIARQLQIPVFKMDTEGLEAMVLQGGRRFFAKPELRHGFLEFNTETQNHTHALADELQYHGFKVSVKGMKEEEYDVKTDTTDPLPAVRDAFVWRP